jgi:hypothetical protein
VSVDVARTNSSRGRSTFAAQKLVHETTHSKGETHENCGFLAAEGFARGVPFEEASALTLDLKLERLGVDN